MRGWKAISFDQFKKLCMFRRPDEAPNGYDACFDERTSFDSCSACICLRWRDIGRVDIKVSKITVRRKPTVQQAKHAKPLKCSDGCGATVNKPGKCLCCSVNN